MCLIAHRNKPGVHIPDDVIEYNLRMNPDGFGIAWRDPDEGLLYEKFSPRRSNDFVALLKRIDATDMEYTAHWRKATHGTVDEEMSHPYPYEDEEGGQYLLFHNGIIEIKPEAGKSDTWQFANGVMSRLPSRWWDNPALVFLVENAIGWSRIIIMDFDSDENIFLNEDDFREIDGMLYSTYPKGYTTATPTAGTTTGKWVSPTPGIETFIPAKAASLVSEVVWYHAGHAVVPLTQHEDPTNDEDLYGACRCSICGTEGEFMVIEGQRYIEIDHHAAYFEDDELYAKAMVN